MASFPPSDHSPKFVCRIIKNGKIRVQNHEDNYFLIKVECRSDAIIIKWLHAAILSCRRWFEFILRLVYYVISCVRPQLGADCFHPKWAVDSRYSWNVHCFQIWWRSHHSAGIGIEKQLAQPSQCCNESGKYCRWLQPTTKSISNEKSQSEWIQAKSLKHWDTANNVPTYTTCHTYGE